MDDANALIIRATLEMLEDGVIHVDTWMALTNNGVDPTMIEDIKP